MAKRCYHRICFQIHFQFRHISTNSLKVIAWLRATPPPTFWNGDPHELVETELRLEWSRKMSACSGL